MPPLTEDIGFLLSRTAALLTQEVNQVLAPEGLRVRSYTVLHLACENPAGISQKSVADASGMDPSQVVALLDGLEERELVRRQPDPNDRRSKLLVATDTGRELCLRAQASVQRAQEEHLHPLPAWMVDGLRDTLRSIISPGRTP
ncbi:MarR family transcriptional regulator [Nocardia speluncae]|uniref:MarR family transcriptional regulator n=2 Tax=Nocardia speluncae TaxID=419477 RepID=A0A846XDG5_9NOCA|nr:MarR family transcriptional regulator [Nocardia speluncae]